MLGDPVRRRILELLADGDVAAGVVVDEVGREFGITQPAVSQHLRVLRESGFAAVRPEGRQRLYALQTEPLEQVDEWLAPFRTFWDQPMDALATEVARGKRARQVRPDR